MKILVYNVRGAHNTQLHPHKTKDIIQFICSSGADIAVLTETHITPENNPLKGFPFAVTATALTKHKGVAIIPLHNRIRLNSSIVTARNVTVKVQSSILPPFHLIGVYAPTSKPKRRRFFEKLELFDSNSIVTGDFNEVYRSEDRNPPKPLSLQAIKALAQFHQKKYVDFASCGAALTYNGPKHSSRIDTAFSNTEGLALSYVSITDPGLSDHCPIMFEMALTNPFPLKPAF